MSVILNMWGEDHALQFVKGNYVNNNNLAIQVIAEDTEYGGWEPWCDLTTNLNRELPDNMAYLDTNNCSPEIIEWLYKNKYVEDISFERSGFCVYPLVLFSDAFMETIVVTKEDLR